MALANNPVAAEQSRILPVTVPWDRVESFVGQLTHDIRNGLNALELQLTFLGEISTDSEAIDEIKRLRSSLSGVTRQLHALRAATSATTPYPLEYPAGEFFEDLHERFAKLYPTADEKIAWSVDVAPDTMLSVDPELTINALLELLVNAMHFAQKDAQPIRVQISSTVEHTVFLVEESQTVTPSVPTHDWGRTPLLTTRRGAYGLGLFRVRRCLETQGSTLEANYSADDQLLTTEVTLRNVSSAQS